MQVRLRVIPNAQHDAVGGQRGGALLVRVRAPAVDGKATAAVLVLVARAFEVSPRAVRLVRGEHNRDKVVEVAVEEQSGQITLKALLGEAPGGVVR